MPDDHDLLLRIDERVLHLQTAVAALARGQQTSQEGISLLRVDAAREAAKAGAKYGGLTGLLASLAVMLVVALLQYIISR